MKKFIKGVIMLALILVLSFFVGMTIGQKVTSIDKTVLTGYKYDKTLKCYKNTKTGIWYVTSVDGKVIPSSEYVSPEYKDKLDGLTVENRPSTSWELVTVNEIDLKENDTFSTIIDKYYGDYFRMDRSWYEAKVKEANGIEDINIIQSGVKFKILVYEDNGN